MATVYPGKVLRFIVTYLLFTALSAAQDQVPPPNGRWEGTITFDKLKVPFTLFIAGEGASVTGSFVNGSMRVTSISGSYSEGMLQLGFPKGNRLQAKFADAALKGTYGSPGFGIHLIEAALYCTCAYEGEAGPDISGLWDLPFPQPWRLAIRPQGEDTLASLHRGEQELGPITGRYDGIQFTLRYFDGTNAMLLEMEPRKDGSLAVTLQEPGQPVRKTQAVK
jgi:hypothetical protein